MVALTTAIGGIGSVLAQLPGLKEKPWLEQFAVTENRSFTYALNNWGEGKIIPVGKGGKEISIQLHIPVTILIEEVLPDGRTVAKKIVPESLETKDLATLKPGKISFRGKVTGDASFEAQVEMDRGVIAVGGRLLDPGTLTKNPLRFGVRVTLPEAYRNAKKTEKDDAKEFAKKLKEDRYAIIWTDGKRLKFNGGDKLEVNPKDVNGPGITELKALISSYQGKTVEFTAAENSKMTVAARAADQLFSDGFTLSWYPDPAKDPDTKARLKFTVK